MRCRVRTDAARFRWCDDSLMPRTLLIVDDHAGFRTAVRRLLEADGFTVVGEAEGAESALPAVAVLLPDVVLLDVALPDGDGFAVCADIMRTYDVTVVLMSSRTITGLRDRLRVSRACGFIAKGDLSGSAVRALTG